MAVHRIKDGLVAFECDNCHDGIETTRHSFPHAKAEAEADGWVFRQRPGGWKHFCSAKCEKEDFLGV